MISRKSRKPSFSGLSECNEPEVNNGRPQPSALLARWACLVSLFCVGFLRSIVGALKPGSVLLEHFLKQQVHLGAGAMMVQDTLPPCGPKYYSRPVLGGDVAWWACEVTQPIWLQLDAGPQKFESGLSST